MRADQICRDDSIVHAAGFQYSISQKLRSHLWTFGGNGCEVEGIHRPIERSRSTSGNAHIVIDATLRTVSCSEGSKRLLGRHARRSSKHAPNEFSRFLCLPIA